MKMKLLAAAIILTTPCLDAEETAQPRELLFNIAKASNPGGSVHYTGKVSFSRKETTNSFKVEWKLSDGSTQSGVGVPFPESGVIAVGYGPDLEGVAIYKKDGNKAEARWSTGKPDSEIGSYDLTRGKKPGLLNITGGGTVTLTPGEDEAGTVKFDLNSGSYSGVVIGQGDYLALATGGKRLGVGIYKQAGDGAEGRWTVVGAEGAGTENLTILEVDGQKVGSDAPAEAAAGDEEAEVKAIAKAVRGNKEELLKLKPTRAQLADIAVSADATKKLETYVKGLFADLPEEGLEADDDETKIVVFSGDDLPGGYQEHAENLNKEVKVYGFKYLNPGKDAGTSFDGLIKVRGKWIMVPKLWRAFAE